MYNVTVWEYGTVLTLARLSEMGAKMAAHTKEPELSRLTGPVTSNVAFLPGKSFIFLSVLLYMVSKLLYKGSFANQCTDLLKKQNCDTVPYNTR